jgi:hypothetical protein
MATVRPLTQTQVEQKVTEALVNAGVQDRDAEYLAKLYAESPRGKELQTDPRKAIAASNCIGSLGVLPI